MTLEELKLYRTAALKLLDEQGTDMPAWEATIVLEHMHALIAVAEAAKLTQYGHTTSKGRWETSEDARNAVTNALAALEAE